MVILGIDPGTRRIGYGVVMCDRNQFTMLDAGILPIASNDHFGAIQEARTTLGAMITKFKPAVVSIERIYFSKNRKTGIRVAEMRGVLLASALEHGIPVEEYGPNEVKSSLTGYGFADKKSVLKMVKLILRKPDLAVIDDASDALAIAIVAGTRRRSFPQPFG